MLPDIWHSKQVYFVSSFNHIYLLHHYEYIFNSPHLIWEVYTHCLPRFSLEAFILLPYFFNCFTILLLQGSITDLTNYYFWMLHNQLLQYPNSWNWVFFSSIFDKEQPMWLMVLLFIWQNNFILIFLHLYLKLNRLRNPFHKTLLLHLKWIQ